MKLFDLITESKSFDTFAEKRLGGATKIVENAKEKGGPARLTYHHFVVKLPYYKKAAAGNLNKDDAKLGITSKATAAAKARTEAVLADRARGIQRGF